MDKLKLYILIPGFKNAYRSKQQLENANKYHVHQLHTVSLVTTDQHITRMNFHYLKTTH